MRYSNRLLCIAVCIMVIVFAFTDGMYVSQSTSEMTAIAMPVAENNKSEYRACWISYIDIQQYLKGKSEAAFRVKVNEMYDTVKKQGLNTVIVHARAMGDAFYESEYFPYSEYISAQRKVLTYDPYKLLVDIAHEKGLRFEAWINPYRISIGDETTEHFMQTDYYNRYQSMILCYTGANGTCMSLDPASETARRLIMDSLEELVVKYPVDGIHFDDYFYVDGMQPTLSEQQKKENVNILVREVYQFARKQGHAFTFGISPAGNPDYARSQGADIDTWLSEVGYVDYIMPQIYWTDRYKQNGEYVSMFRDRCQAWEDLRQNDVQLYLGMALYRAGEVSEQEPDWSEKSNNLASQLAFAYETGYEGFGLFRYAYLDEPEAQEELEAVHTYLAQPAPQDMNKTNAYIVYASRIDTCGWQSPKTDGVVSGVTTMQGQIQAVRIALGGYITDGKVSYEVKKDHPEKPDAVTGIEIWLEGTVKEEYDIAYRVYQIGNGWSGWSKNGNLAGNGTFISAIQIKVIKKA